MVVALVYGDDGVVGTEGPFLEAVGDCGEVEREPSVEGVSSWVIG